MNQAITDLFEHPQGLPAMPELMQKLIASFGDEDMTSAQLAAQLSTDPVLSARLLQLANSAYFHVPFTVATVSDAVAMLGFSNVRTLVISMGLTGSFKAIAGFDRRQFWRHSLYTAVAARRLATPLGLPPELAFSVGLMHALGELVMQLAMPAEMRTLNAACGLLDPGRAAAQQQAFGFSQATVGAELARHWQFPPLFASAIAAAANPLAQQPLEALGALVHVAAWLARLAQDRPEAVALADSWPDAVAERLGLAQTSTLQGMPPLQELCGELLDVLV
jgi:HD-like signal output (HDOD) protein